MRTKGLESGGGRQKKKIRGEYAGPRRLLPPDFGRTGPEETGPGAPVCKTIARGTYVQFSRDRSAAASWPPLPASPPPAPALVVQGTCGVVSRTIAYCMVQQAAAVPHKRFGGGQGGGGGWRNLWLHVALLHPCFVAFSAFTRFPSRFGGESMLQASSCFTRL